VPLPETVRSFWHGGPLPPLSRACLRSFAREGHEVELFAYHALDVPGDVRLQDAEQILPASDLTLFGGNIPAFADLFRYQLLHDRGGWWVDTDVYCLTSALPVAPRAWAPEGGDILNNAILKFPAGDPTCAELACLARERAIEPASWGALGPSLLTEVLARSTTSDHAGTRAEFYPLHWLEAHYAWLPERRAELEARLAGASFLHLWMKALTDCGIELDRAPPPGSWLADATRDEAWPGRKLPWHDWRTRRAISRYHEEPSVRSKLARIQGEHV
jgi:hypothetical protein